MVVELSWAEDFPANLLEPNLNENDVLRCLALCPDAEQRMSLADHLNTPEKVLLLLADDDDADVRYALAENHNISRYVLNKLRLDSNPYVACRAAKTMTRMGMGDFSTLGLVTRRAA